MFFWVSQLKEAFYPANHLQNPVKKDNPMTVNIIRTQSRTAFFTINSKKSFTEYWDTIDQKKIPKKLWTSEMKDFSNQKIQETPAPSFMFKFTIVGWIFTAAIIGFFVYLIYDSVKPDAPKSAKYISMEKAPQAGDIYFGRFEAFTKPGDRIASDVGFGWFKISQVNGDTYTISKSKEMSDGYKAKEQLNNTEFETNGTPAKITEQAGYMLNLKATDGKMEIYFTDKK